MTQDPEKLISLFLFDGSLMSPAERQRLSEWIQKDPENAKDFIRCSLLHRGIYDLLKEKDAARGMIVGEDLKKGVADTAIFENTFWNQLAREEQTAEPVIIRRPKKKKKDAPQDVHAGPIQKARKKTSRFSRLTAIFSLAALLFLAVYLQMAPSRPVREVATIIDFLNLKWTNSDLPMKSGTRLSTHEGPLQITEGCLKIELDQGVEVVIEGPAEFEITDSDRTFLRYGKLFARVAESGRGFTVRTPSARIVDLGTEFGVFSDLEGESEIHVIRGKVDLTAGSRRTGLINEILAQSQAMSIDAAGLTASPVAYKEQFFTRDIVSSRNAAWQGQTSVSVASLVAGGDGFSRGNPTQGIDPVGGKVNEQARRFNSRFGREHYQRTKNLPCIDGVFVADDAKGGFQISSGKHRFRFYDTTQHFWTDITANVWIPKGQVKNPEQLTDSQRAVLPIVGGKTYGGGEHSPAILITPNAGITFDMNEIRKLRPETELDSFRAVCGLAENARQSGAPVEFWVLVDGQKKFSYTADPKNSASRRIEIPIQTSDRFLTLAATVRGNSIPYNWSLFADPAIELKPKN